MEEFSYTTKSINKHERFNMHLERWKWSNSTVVRKQWIINWEYPTLYYEYIKYRTYFTMQMINILFCVCYKIQLVAQGLDLGALLTLILFSLANDH